MDRGGITRQRISLWMAAVLATVLLIVVLYGVLVSRHSASDSTAAQAAADTSIPTDSLPYSTRPHYPSRHTYARSSRQAAYAPTAQSRPAYAPSTESRPADRQPRSKYLRIELNQADSTDLVQLYNVGPTFARRIMRYRDLLGGFVTTSQLWEIYGMDSVRYNDIAPHVTIDTTAVVRLDLNSATLDQLKRHPYLDYQQARAIVRQRETSGPYHSVHDLAQLPLIDNNTIRKLTPYLICNSQPSK